MVLGFFPLTAATLAISFVLLIKLPNFREVDVLLRQQAHVFNNTSSNYRVASFVPQVLGSFTEAIVAGDARPIIVRNYLERYNSPLVPYADVFIKSADEYGLDNYMLPVAIAQQESNLGKVTPPKCHNAWGWGIHKRGTLCFESWEEGIDTYIRDFTESYGEILEIEDEDEMLQVLMARYAPVSIESAGGAWAKGVRQFLDDIREQHKS